MRYVSSILASLIVASCGNHSGSQGQNPQLPEGLVSEMSSVERFSLSDEGKTDATAVATGINKMGHSLLEEFEAAGKNVLVSPYSLGQALGMVVQGAAGKTEAEIFKTLNNTLTKDKFSHGFNALDQAISANVKQSPFKNANSIWTDKNLQVQNLFLDQTKRFFGAGLFKTSFADSEVAKKGINDWTAQQTDNRIQNLLENLSPDTAIVLVNAIHFKANWLRKFQEVKNFLYTPAEGTKKLVTGLHIEHAMQYLENSDFQGVVIPYASDSSNTFEMVIALPKPPHESFVKPSVSDFMSQMAQAKFTPVSLMVPEFGFEWYSSLRPSLQKLGLETAFSEAADFSGISKSSKLLISDVVQKTFIKVDKEGTEAAAATAIIFAETSAPSVQPKVMSVDHPFYFAIRHSQSGAMIFLGKVENP